MFIDGREWEVSISMTVGRLFHDFAEAFFNVVSPSLFERDDYEESVKEEVMNLPKLLRRPVYNFLLFEKKRYEICKQNFTTPWLYYYPVAVEYKLSNLRLGIRGKIDRIDRDIEGNILLEYKVSQSKLNMSRLRKELNFYVLLLNNRFNIKRIGCYNPLRNEVATETVSERSLSHTLKLLVKMKKSLESSEFPKRETLQCFYCPVRSWCIQEG